MEDTLDFCDMQRGLTTSFFLRFKKTIQPLKFSFRPLCNDSGFYRYLSHHMEINRFTKQINGLVLRWEKPSQNLELIFVLVKILYGNLWKIGPSRATGFIFDKREKEGLTSPLVRFNARYISPNDPLPIFRISLYLPPTTNSDLVVDAILWILKYNLKFF